MCLHRGGGFDRAARAGPGCHTSSPVSPGTTEHPAESAGSKASSASLSPLPGEMFSGYRERVLQAS